MNEENNVGTTGQTVGQDQNNAGATDQNGGKTFTQEELDRIVEKRLNRERKKFTSLLSVTDPREAELEERERAVALKELQAEAKGTLASKGIPTEAVELLNYTDKESCDKSIKALEQVAEEIARKAVSKLLRGSEPIKRAPHEAADAAVRNAFGLSSR